MEKQKVNNIKIKPVITQNFNPKTVKGYEFFSDPYARCGIVARTQSGKTSTIYNVLEATVSKGTNVVIFCPSINTDATYKRMLAMLKKKKANVTTYDHFIQGRGNVLNDLVRELEHDKDDKKGKKAVSERTELTLEQIMWELPPPENQVFNKPQKAIKPKKKVKKKKKLEAETIVIIDDLSSGCRDSSITRLLCKARHLKMRLFISLHAISNLHPDGLRQLTNILLFPNIDEQKIIDVVEKCGLNFKNDTRKRYLLHEMYKDATQEKYNFLNIDKVNMVFRKNFSEKYIIHE